MIEVSVVHTPTRPVGDWAEHVNSANMFEVRIGEDFIFATVDKGQAQLVRDRLIAALSRLQQPLQQIAGLTRA